jgi:methylamine dehydrogenase accessory protein MauD
MTIWQISLVGLWIVVILIAFLLAGALRQIGLLQLRFGDDPGALITATGLERGVAAPDFSAIDSETAEPIRLSELNSQARVLVFMTPSCLSCRELVPGINEVMSTRGDEFDWLVVCHGGVESCRGLARMNRLRARMIVDTAGEIETAYEVHVTPFAYVLDYAGRVLIRGVANDWRQLESLLEQEGTIQGAPWQTIDQTDLETDSVENTQGVVS